MTRDEVFAVVQKAALEVLPHVDPHELTIDRRLRDFGASSIDRADVVVQVMEALDLRAPFVEFADVEDLAGLTDAFHRLVLDKARARR